MNSVAQAGRVRSALEHPTDDDDASSTGVEGELGNFTAHLRQHPRYVDVDKCIACGKCAESCPRETTDEFNQKINTRKAIFVKYPQAVPLKYQIDPVVCNKMRGGRCRECEKACPCGAIRLRRL